MHIVFLDLARHTQSKSEYIINLMRKNGHIVKDYHSTEPNKAVPIFELSQKEIEDLKQQSIVPISRKHGKNYTRLSPALLESEKIKTVNHVARWISWVLEYHNNNKIDLIITDGNHQWPYMVSKVLKDKFNIPLLCIENSFNFQRIYMDPISAIGNEMEYMKKLWKETGMQYNTNSMNALLNKKQGRGQVGQAASSSLSATDYIHQFKWMNRNKKKALIVGQVDYDSVICRDIAPLKNIDEFFAVTMKACRNVGLEMVYRLHPWDKELGRNQTYQFFNGIPRSDFIVVTGKEYNSYDLLAGVDIVIGLTSQFGVEAAASGVPLITMGDAFYNVGGFNFQATPDNLEEQIKVAISSNNTEKAKQFASFLLDEYMVACDGTEDNRILDLVKKAVQGQ